MRTFVLSGLFLTACGGTEMEASVPLGRALGPANDAQIGAYSNETFDVRSVVAVPVGSPPRGECHRNNVKLLISGGEIICTDGQYTIEEPRLEMMVPFRPGTQAQPADGECILEGEDRFYVFAEWRDAGTHDATGGRISIDAIDTQGIQGSFELDGWEDASFRLEGSFNAKRCGI